MGYLGFDEEYKKLADLDPTKITYINKARKIVEEIDKEVTYYVSMIIRSGKIPIVVGGGHNNAYGMLKGSSLALNKPINAINMDAHSDFRSLEGRHSGNGFSYAFYEGFLSKYTVFGLQENYSSKSVLKSFETLSTNLRYT